MTIAEIYKKNGEITGFKVNGHSDYGEKGNDIVCASVSSAVMMTANMITDVFYYKADVSVFSDTIYLKTHISGDKVLQGIYRGLEIQLLEIAGEFKKNLKVKYTEV